MDKVHHFDQTPVRGLSAHDMIIAVFSFHAPKFKPTYRVIQRSVRVFLVVTDNTLSIISETGTMGRKRIITPLEGEKSSAFSAL